MSPLRRLGAVLVTAALGVVLSATAAHADWTFYRTGPHIGACWNKVTAYGGVYQVSNVILNGTSSTHTVIVQVSRPGVGITESHYYTATAGQWVGGPIANVAIVPNDSYIVYLDGVQVVNIPANGIPWYMDNCQTTESPSSKIRTAISYGMSQLDAVYTGCSAGAYRMGAVAPYTMYHDGSSCGQRTYLQPAGTAGFDCSGLMYKMFQAAGVYFPWTSSSAMKSGIPQISKSQIRVGDLLVKDGHVAMYLGDGDNDGVPSVLEATPKFQNADGSWDGVVISDARPYLNSSLFTAHRVSGT